MMVISPVLDIVSNFTLYLLFVALGIFVWLAWRSRSVKSFQFQISIFLLIWIGGEFMFCFGFLKIVNRPKRKYPIEK